MIENKKLKPEEIQELLLALGFHHLDSRARWKLKFCDTIQVTDAELRMENERDHLAEFLSRRIASHITSLEKLIRKKKILLAFFQ